MAAHRGQRVQSAADSWVVRGKTLGIVGYGNIGAQLSVIAEALGLHVVFYDPSPQASARRRGLPDPGAPPGARADVLSLHVPNTKATRWIMRAHTHDPYRHRR